MTEQQQILPRQHTARALAEAMFPAGEKIPAGDPDAITQTVAGYLVDHPWLRRAMASGLVWLESRFMASHGKRFCKADVSERRRFLARISRSRLGGNLLRATISPFKAAWLLDENHQKLAGSRPPVQVPSQVEQFRWQAQISRAADVDEDQELEADVVVIGSGAGGGAAAYELASRGLAVVIIEEGEYYNRTDFNGNLTEVMRKLYRGYGATCATGNVFIPVPVGRNVGGTTTINSGTCMRTPSQVLERWRCEKGLSNLTEDEMAPWFESVEEMLCVTRAEEKYVGPIGDVIAEGARKMGFTELHPLMRNARGCDGQGLCQFGCPTDAKQSTNVSYIPRALDRGAFLFTGFRAHNLLRNGQTVQGVRAEGINGNGKRVSLTLRAPSVVVAMGTFLTPLFLQQNGVRNRHLGRHLTIHPAGVVNALFPEREFGNSHTIPQGFGVADLADQGLMFEGGTIPFAGHGLLNNLYGDEFVRFTEQYQQTAYFGFMVRDTSEGRVRRGPHRDLPLIRYHMNNQDFALFLRGIEILARIYLRAGAREVMIPGLSRIVTIRSEEELDAFMARKHRPKDFMMTAYHPLGTARISGIDDGVCDGDHRVNGWQGLYVMDGSSVPSSLGANPQVTIMSLAARAAARLAERITSGETA